jgi:hypothetical protein
MTSAINFLSINENFPVAGQDNDTQVFRDNFDTIKNNFRAAQEEISVLQTFAASVDADNDFNNNKITGAILQRTSDLFLDLGDFNGDAIDWEAGPYQKFAVTGAVNFAFENFYNTDTDATARVGKVTLELTVGDGEFSTITFVSTGGTIINKLDFPAVDTEEYGTGDVVILSPTDPTFIEVWQHSQTNLYVRYINPPAAVIPETRISTATDVLLTELAAEQVLKYNGTRWVNSAVPAPELAIDALTDVVITGSPATNQVLKWGGEEWVNGAINIADVPVTLNDINDVTITSAGNNSILKYETAVGKWVNATYDQLVTYSVTILDNGSGTQDVFFLNGVAVKTNTGVTSSLNFVEGYKYRFDISDSTNAAGPLKFSTTPDTAVPASISNYTTGVTQVGTAGTPGAYVDITITSSTPSTLYLWSDETGVDTSNIGGSVGILKTTITKYTGSEDLASGTAASLVRTASYFTTGGAETATLANGVEGQIKVFATVTAVGNMVITVNSAGWKESGSGTITFGTRGQACTLQYITGKWFCVGNNGATFL